MLQFIPTRGRSHASDKPGIAGHFQGTRRTKTALTSENHRAEFSQVSAAFLASSQVSARLVQFVNYR